MFAPTLIRFCFLSLPLFPPPIVFSLSSILLLFRKLLDDGHVRNAMALLYTCSIICRRKWCFDHHFWCKESDYYREYKELLRPPPPPFLSSDSVAPTFFAEDAHFALVSHSVQPALVCVCAGFRKSLVLEDSLNTFWQLAKKFQLTRPPPE